MRLIIKLAGCILPLFISSISVAAPIPESFRGLYLGGNVSKHQIKNDYISSSIVGGMFKVGYDFNKIFAIEGHVGATTTKSYILVDQTGQEIGDYSLRGLHTGIYGRANWRLVNVTLYGLLGLGYYKTTETFSYTGSYNTTLEHDATGLSYGVGVDLFGSRQTAVSLNWLQLINTDVGNNQRLRVNVLHLGITYYFKQQRTNQPISPRDRLNH